MGTIVFSENRHAFMIPYEDGEALCNPSTPQEEGAKWVYSLGRLPTDHVVVLGLGAGHHIAALKDIYPHLQITVIERRDNLLQMFRNQYPELWNEIEVVCLDSVSSVTAQAFYQRIVEEHSYVISFRESWGVHCGFYTELFAAATGRSVISLNYHFREIGMNLKSRYNPHPLNLSVSPEVSGFEISQIEEAG